MGWTDELLWWYYQSSNSSLQVIMGGKQSTVTPDRYRSPTTTSDSVGVDTMPTSPPALPLRNFQLHATPNLPQNSSFSLSEEANPLPPFPLRTSTDSLVRPLSQTRFASRPLHGLPNNLDTPTRSERFLDFEALLAGLNEINRPQSRRDRSLTHHHHQHPRYQERNFTTRIDRREQTSRGVIDDPLLFLRSLTRTRCCPNCSETVTIEEYQDHIFNCSTQCTVNFNENTLTSNCGECSICLEDMSIGDQIARLPCLCIYHIICIQGWFQMKATCPQHPDLNLTTM